MVEFMGFLAVKYFKVCSLLNGVLWNIYQGHLSEAQFKETVFWAEGNAPLKECQIDGVHIYWKSFNIITHLHASKSQLTFLYHHHHHHQYCHICC